MNNVVLSTLSFSELYQRMKFGTRFFQRTLLPSWHFPLQYAWFKAVKWYKTKLTEKCFVKQATISGKMFLGRSLT